MRALLKREQAAVGHAFRRDRPHARVRLELLHAPSAIESKQAMNQDGTSYEPFAGRTAEASDKRPRSETIPAYDYPCES